MCKENWVNHQAKFIYFIFKLYIIYNYIKSKMHIITHNLANVAINLLKFSNRAINPLRY